MEAIVRIDHYLNRIEEMIFNDEVEEALNILNNLLFEEPGYAPLHNFIGWAYMYYGHDQARAALHFQTAIRFAPTFAPPYLHLGDLCNKAARFEEAIEHFRAGLDARDAQKHSLLEGIAYAHEMRKEYRLAIRAYRDAAAASMVDFEFDRMRMAMKRCRRKRLALMFAF